MITAPHYVTRPIVPASLWHSFVKLSHVHCCTTRDVSHTTRVLCRRPGDFWITPGSQGLASIRRIICCDEWSLENNRSSSSVVAARLSSQQFARSRAESSSAAHLPTSILLVFCSTHDMHKSFSLCCLVSFRHISHDAVFSIHYIQHIVSGATTLAQCIISV